ncbi:hypothetical protein BT63DRAFT_459721 [Microthyrium microscopicum]|uniref:Uncharacterized protein n=1 Tax=Microthyrium microscopicum TaxID=703497 RepID=A0A6A6U0I2_9PEZI|nr:hypothetical protein BT63DRAFT_459721 [Microthyrium microscopicum]
MVWPFNSNPDDPLKDLDPNLRQFLEKEAPKASPKTLPPIAKPRTDSHPVNNDPTISSTNHTEPQVPAQSLYQDGRYAHLWKTYKAPGSYVEAKSDSEVLRDISLSYKARKREIAKIALENCSFEALAEDDCWKNGSYGKRLMMCRDESRALDRCTMLQTKFLGALGYLSYDGRPQEVEDQIQMHADRLYQQMIQHEVATREAKEKGLPAPQFKPIMSRENLAKVLGVSSPEALRVADVAQKMAETTDLSHVPEDAREKYQQTVKNMTPDERMVEEASRVGNIRDQSKAVQEYERILNKSKQEREQRKQEGAETITDRLSKWWGREEPDL